MSNESKLTIEQTIQTKVTFKVDDEILRDLVNTANQWTLTLVQMPMILREVMRVMSRYEEQMHHQKEHMEDLVVAVLTVLIIDKVDKIMQDSLIQMVHSTVKVYYGLSKHPMMFRPGQPVELSAKCLCL